MLQGVSANLLSPSVKHQLRCRIERSAIVDERSMETRVGNAEERVRDGGSLKEEEMGWGSLKGTLKGSMGEVKGLV